MFNAIQPKTPGAVMAGLQQHGASVGARKMMQVMIMILMMMMMIMMMMQWEFRHAKEWAECSADRHCGDLKMRN